MAKATREAYGEKIAQLVQENPKIVVLDADLAGSTYSGKAQEVCPERFFDMGIAEANMIGVSAGLAASGYIPFASSFAMFCTGRVWEQIRNSVAYPHLNVKIVGSHSGITVGEDGVTHQAIEDIAIMRDITDEQNEREKKENISRQTIEVADKVVDKQMRIVQEIASLLGETAAETKIALAKLKESIQDE